MTFSKEKVSPLVVLRGLMPRRVLIPALLLLLSSTIFAQTVPGTTLHHYDALHHLEVGGAVPVFFEKDEVVSGPGLSAGYYYDTLFSVFGVPVGLGAWGTLSVLLFGQGNVGAGFTLLAGPVVTVWQNERFSVPVAFGLYTDDAFLRSRVAAGIGAGVNASFQWRFSSSGYAYGRLQGAYEFVNREFVLSPGIGVGITR